MTDVTIIVDMAGQSVAGAPYVSGAGNMQGPTGFVMSSAGAPLRLATLLSPPASTHTLICPRHRHPHLQAARCGL
tara:strand:- start:193 stop:417 length:225 start_codon:yes stop_codon:yes gene_type:complete